MDVRSPDRALDAVLRITITLICVSGTFLVSCYVLSVVFR